MSTEYTVTVYTGACNYAGTDADVYIQLFGDRGTSGVYYLDNEENNFEKGKNDVFAINTIDLGNLKKVLIGHNNARRNAGWFLDKVEVRNEETNQTWVFPCNRWLADDEDDRRLARRLSTSGVIR